ncbi:MAG: ATP-dependent helicase [Verrucomicrobiae bacterium]|nr:ATP-dependent helicase [Verrucomicrobiae bacterium]
MARDYTLQRVPRQTESQIDYAAELNPQQFAAVTAPPGPALVIAGAGSGKTRTLTYRVAYLLDNGIKAGNILLLTFTNKAAREMLDRVEQLVPQDTRDIWGGTFHSIGNRILRRHAELLGWDRNFTIMDREDQKDLMSSVVSESDVDPKAYRFPKADVLLDMISLSQNTNEDLDELVAWRYPYFDHLREPIKRVRAAYDKKKLETNSMDFDDLLIRTLELLRDNEGLRESYQKQFEFVLVDEYQDTNHIQAELIDLLAARSKNVMVVGDDAQSIYSWRGADFRNILEFPERYPGAAVYKIETNYRSVPEILTLANSAIMANREQFRKDLEPHRPEREMLPALIPVHDPNTQAAFVAQRILELRDEGIELEEIAILYRAHFHSMEIQMELTNRGIPFMITSGLRFFEQAHIKDVAAFIKLVSNRRDEVAYKRIVRMLPGIGAKGADKLWREWLGSPIGKGEVVTNFSEIISQFTVPAKAKKAWEQLGYTFDELIDDEGNGFRPAQMIPSIVGGVYDDYLRSKFSNYESRKQDISQLERYSEKFENLDEFLSQLSLLAGQDAVGATRQEPDKESVTLSSIHQAKGLEWRAVFVVWLTDGMFPNSRVIEEDDDGKGLEEERRLFYVAVTRAKDELYLTYPLVWPNAHNGEVLQRASRFLEEIPGDLMEEWRVGTGW